MTPSFTPYPVENKYQELLGSQQSLTPWGHLWHALLSHPMNPY